MGVGNMGGYFLHKCGINPLSEIESYLGTLGANMLFCGLVLVAFSALYQSPSIRKLIEFLAKVAIDRYIKKM